MVLTTSVCLPSQQISKFTVGNDRNAFRKDYSRGQLETEIAHQLEVVQPGLWILEHHTGKISGHHQLHMNLSTPKHIQGTLQSPYEQSLISSVKGGHAQNTVVIFVDFRKVYMTQLTGRHYLMP